MKEYYIPKQTGQTKKGIIKEIGKVESFFTNNCSPENAFIDHRPEVFYPVFYSKQSELINLVFSLERIIVEGDLDVRKKTASNIKKFQAFFKEYQSDFKDLLDKYKAIEEYNNNEREKLDNRVKRLEEITEEYNLAKILAVIDQELQAKNLPPIQWSNKEFRCRKKNKV